MPPRKRRKSGNDPLSLPELDLVVFSDTLTSDSSRSDPKKQIEMDHMHAPEGSATCMYKVDDSRVKIYRYKYICRQL